MGGGRVMGSRVGGRACIEERENKRATRESERGRKRGRRGGVGRRNESQPIAMCLHNRLSARLAQRGCVRVCVCACLVNSAQFPLCLPFSPTPTLPTPAMPSNQRPLTRPRPKSTSGVLYVAAAPLVLRAGNFLTLFCTLFLSLSLLFTLRSPDDVASAARGLEGYVAGGLKSAAAGRTGVTGTKGCRPLRLPGWIDLGGGSASASAQPKWSTFDSLCPSSSIVSSLSSSSSSASLPWLANRTILVVGDEEPTHSRLERLCGTLGGRSAKVDVAHPWGQALERVEAEVGKLGMGSYCYVERVE